jgi:hypothetical protein
MHLGSLPLAFVLPVPFHSCMTNCQMFNTCVEIQNKLILLEVIAPDDVLAAGGGDEDAASLDGVLDGGDLVALHGGLKSVDWVDLGDDDAAAESAKGLGRAFADVAISGNHGDLLRF